MWIELIVAVCLLSTPTECRDMHFQFVEETTLHGCMFQAQPYMARWIDEHPQWRIKRWKCAISGESEIQI